MQSIGNTCRVAFWMPTPKARLEPPRLSQMLDTGALSPTCRYGVSGSHSTAAPALETQCVLTSVFTPLGPLSKG